MRKICGKELLERILDFFKFVTQPFTSTSNLRDIAYLRGHLIKGTLDIDKKRGKNNQGLWKSNSQHEENVKILKISIQDNQKLRSFLELIYLMN